MKTMMTIRTSLLSVVTKRLKHRLKKNETKLLNDRFSSYMKVHVYSTPEKEKGKKEKGEHVCIQYYM